MMFPQKSQKKQDDLILRRCMYCNRIYGYYRGRTKINLKSPTSGHLATIKESVGICPPHAVLAIAGALQGIDFFAPLSPT